MALNGNFPASLETKTTYAGTDKVSVIDHANVLTKIEDAIVDIQTKVGADSSVVTTTQDFKLSGVPAGDKTSSLTGTETLTNKTLTTPTIASIVNGGAVTIPSGVDTLVARTSTDTMANKTLTAPIITTPTITSPVLNGNISGDAFLDEDTMFSDSATKTASQQSIKAYVDNAVGGGAPNSFSVGGLTRSINFSDEMFTTNLIVGNVYRLGTVTGGKILEDLNITTTWADADSNPNNKMSILNGFLYHLLSDTLPNPDTYRLYRYNLTNLTAAGTLMTFAGATVLASSNFQIESACDGVNFYFSHEAGNSASQFIIAKYTLSGTTLTYSSSITLSDSGTFNAGFAVDESENIYTMNSGTIKKYNSSGTLQSTSAVAPFNVLLNFKGFMYGGGEANDVFIKLLG